MPTQPTPSSDESIAHLLGQPVAVTETIVRASIADGTCDSLIFELYKEATTVAVVAAHISRNENGAVTRNQAICLGLIVRIAKFMTTVMQLTHATRRREVVLSLNRSILESAVNLRFLLAKNDPAVFDSFVTASLGSERELFDVINANIARRNGVVLPIERRMLDSVERVVRLSGLRMENVSPRRQEWAGSLRDRMRFLGEDSMYLFVQRIPSHAVHGSWIDLLLHHLNEEGDGFTPDSDWKDADARILGPVAQLVLTAVGQYLQMFFPNEAGPIHQRISDLKERLTRADAAHEEWMNQGHVE